ncbi:MAG TPA: glucokinase [Caldimonas sp.]|nr:glucokinase [Caldimonas sp.]
MDAVPGPAPFPRLLADVGGTHARFGIVASRGEGVERIRQVVCDDHASLEAAIASYLRDAAAPPPASCAIAIASPLTGDRVTMTNRDWSFSIESLRVRLGVDRVLVLNDFTALALALPTLSSGEREAVGGGDAFAGAPIALIGPGTGLGVGGLIDAGGRRLPLASEGGHVTLSAGDAREARLVAALGREFGHASAERALSGAGLVNLYRFACAEAGSAPLHLEPQEVTERALERSDERSVEAVELFFSLLGVVAGNLALTLGARGGVYIGGGIVGRLGDWIHRSTFRARFEAKGRRQAYLASIPVWLIKPESPPALRGANVALDAPQRTL